MTAPPMMNGYMGLRTGVEYLRKPKNAILSVYRGCNVCNGCCAKVSGRSYCQQRALLR